MTLSYGISFFGIFNGDFNSDVIPVENLWIDKRWLKKQESQNMGKMLKGRLIKFNNLTFSSRQIRLMNERNGWYILGLQELPGGS